jgi:hypothetical protein
MSRKQIARVRRICLALPGTTEKLSHGEPTFFLNNKVFCMFANNHHSDGHIAVWIPVPPGTQEGLIDSAPNVFFMPPYVGWRGWVGIELARIPDADLTYHIQVAWELVGAKQRTPRARAATPPAKRTRAAARVKSHRNSGF